MEIAISSELGMNVNAFELQVDSLMPSLFSLTSSIAILAFLVPICHSARKCPFSTTLAHLHPHTLTRSTKAWLSLRGIPRAGLSSL